MLERTIIRYLSWGGMLIVGILVCGAIWNWKLFSLALSFAGLLGVALAAIADRASDKDSVRETAQNIACRPERRASRLRILLKEGISCLFFLPVFLLFLY